MPRTLFSCPIGTCFSTWRRHSVGAHNSEAAQRKRSLQRRNGHVLARQHLRLFLVSTPCGGASFSHRSIPRNCPLRQHLCGINATMALETKTNYPLEQRHCHRTRYLCTSTQVFYFKHSHLYQNRSFS